MAEIGKVVADEIKLLKRRLTYLEAVAKEYGTATGKAEKRIVKKMKKMSDETKAKIRAAAKKRWAKVKKAAS